MKSPKLHRTFSLDFHEQNAKEDGIADEQTVWIANDGDSSSESPVIGTFDSSSSKTMWPRFQGFEATVANEVLCLLCLHPKPRG